METKFNTRKETRLAELYQLQNELRSLRGEELMDLDNIFASYKFRKEADNMLERDIKDRIEHCHCSIVKQIAENERNTRTEAYWQTDEGMARKAALLARKDEEIAAFEQYKAASLDVMKEWIKDFLGAHWTVQYLYEQKITFSMWDADKAKFIFGSDIEVWAERHDYWTKGEKFETNVGTMGTFDIGDNRIGERARFYIDLGRFLSDDTKMNQLKFYMFSYAEGLRERVESIQKLNAELLNPLAL